MEDDYTPHPKPKVKYTTNEFEGIDGYGLKLHFQLLESKLDDQREELKDVKEFLRENRKDYQYRISRLENRLWALMVMALSSLVSVLGSVAMEFFK